MKKHIKLYSFLLFFFTSVGISQAQSTDAADSSNQEGVEQQSDNALGHPGNFNGNNENSGSTDGQSSTTPPNTDNELLNAIINNNNAPQPERVKGTRLPNEYSSGRTGGQYSFSQNPATAKPKTETPAQNHNPDYGNGFVDDQNKAPETQPQTGDTK